MIPKMKSLVVAIAAVLGIAGGTVLLVQPPVASAAQNSVDLVQVCKENYKQPTAQVGQLSGHADPYSFYCFLEEPNQSVNAGLPANLNVTVGSTQVTLGDLDVQAYCNKHHPGSRATGRMNLWMPYWTCDS